MWNHRSSFHNESDLFQEKVLYSTMPWYNYQAFIAPVYIEVNHLVIPVDCHERKLIKWKWRIKNDNIGEDNPTHVEDDHDEDSSD